jgi:chromate reductase, NAD(P)H dehydrogenase (quinone)
MSALPRVLVFAGSARRDSLNKKLARVAERHARAAGASVTFIDLDDYALPVYHGDLERASGPPAPALALRTLFIEHDALIVASPENNSSVSSLLKNTIDWISRAIGDGQGNNSGTAPYRGKLAALMSASPGAYGGARGLPHLRQILSTLGVTVLGPQVNLAHADKAFDASGALLDARSDALAQSLARTLVEMAARLGAESR